MLNLKQFAQGCAQAGAGDLHGQPVLHQPHPQRHWGYTDFTEITYSLKVQVHELHTLFKICPNFFCRAINVCFVTLCSNSVKLGSEP